MSDKSMDYLLKKIVSYRSQGIEDMIKHKEIFVDSIMMPYLMKCYESKTINEALCHHLFEFKPTTNEDLDEALRLQEDGHVLWVHKHQMFDPDGVKLCGWIIDCEARRKNAVGIVEQWIEDKKAGHLPEGE